MTIPACPLHTGKCYEGTDYDEGKVRDLQRLLIWSWDRSPCACGLLTRQQITSRCIIIKGNPIEEKFSSHKFISKMVGLDKRDEENKRTANQDVEGLIAKIRPKKCGVETE